MLNTGIITVSYIIATILFILALGGLSNQETARKGNWYGIIGMTIALLATILGIGGYINLMRVPFHEHTTNTPGNLFTPFRDRPFLNLLLSVHLWL